MKVFTEVHHAQQARDQIILVLVSEGQTHLVY